jgi:hypothetical protein
MGGHPLNDNVWLELAVQDVSAWRRNEDKDEEWQWRFYQPPNEATAKVVRTLLTSLAHTPPATSFACCFKLSASTSPYLCDSDI